jgi:carbon monoxide dehydrogenase subunit G
MVMSGERLIEAPKAQVWAALNDPVVLQSCLPGCRTFEAISETEMLATAALTIGPMPEIFSCKLLLSDLDPPNGYTISGEGSAETAGSASASARVRLHDAGRGTKLTYAMRSSFEGELTSLGQEFLDSNAKKYADAFINHLAASIAQPAPLESEPQIYHLAHEDHDHDPTNPHYFGLPIGVILAGAVAVVSVGLVLAKFIF